MIRYKHATDIQARIENIAKKLGMKHDISRIVCVRSIGSQSRRVIARCHAMPRILQFALATDAHYVIEVISERFDKMSHEEQDKTLIHELMHIPKSFGGGFIYHNVVNRSNVEMMYKRYKNNQQS